MNRIADYQLYFLGGKHEDSHRIDGDGQPGFRGLCYRLSFGAERSGARSRCAIRAAYDIQSPDPASALYRHPRR
jgi:hypothetical protein